jgi:hypothetical protein
MPNDSGDSPPAPNLESYTDNGDGTVTDKVTGLMWTQTVSTASLTWGNVNTAGTAQAYCASQTTGGHTDWRLPSIIELVSIDDLTKFAPSINTTYFLGFTSSNNLFVWSSTPFVGGRALFANFSSGSVEFQTPASQFAALCVR